MIQQTSFIQEKKGEFFINWNWQQSCIWNYVNVAIIQWKTTYGCLPFTDPIIYNMPVETSLWHLRLFTVYRSKSSLCIVYIAHLFGNSEITKLHTIEFSGIVNCAVFRELLVNISSKASERKPYHFHYNMTRSVYVAVVVLYDVITYVTHYAIIIFSCITM
jgi:hypothetical protein